jgi:hypothetical protein
MAGPDSPDSPFPFLRRIKVPGAPRPELSRDPEAETERVLRARLPGVASVVVAGPAVAQVGAAPGAPATVAIPRGPDRSAQPTERFGAEVDLSRVRFRPMAPGSLQEAGLTGGEVESLIVKFLLGNPGTAGREISWHLGLSDRLTVDLLGALKHRKILFHKTAGTMGDFVYELSEEGRSLAFDLQRVSRYAGRAPVTMEQYAESVAAQSVSLEHPKESVLREAFRDLLVEDAMLRRLGPAITAGKGCFFFGPPGNGKTSFAERITRAFGSPIYIPYAIKFGGQLIQVFDPAVHEPVDRNAARAVAGDDRMDHRWVLCKRPTIVVGGELTMDQLELGVDEWAGTCEAPIQMKANGGTLVIDDLGRQAMTPTTLLNRWIVPMEKRVDFLTVPGGRKMEVPFDLMLVFSTNLEPRSLVDDAFLRRIPYKVHVGDPDEGLFRLLMARQADALGMELAPGAIEHLFARHYHGTGRALRKCHPRDLLLQVRNICLYRELPMRADEALLDEAVELYFSVV